MTERTVAISDRGRGRRQLPEEVAAYVRELIISGQVRPGEYLRLDGIAEAVGVSNTPVREGLLALRSEGFVELVPRRGFVAAAFGEQDVRDLFWVQAHLAGELASRAVGRITPEQFDRLETMIVEQDRASDDGDAQRIGEIGHAFHREINLAADSRRLAFLLSAAVRQLPNRFYASIAGRVESARDDHPRMLEALRRGDADAMGELMSSHILAGSDQLVEELAASGLWPEQESAS